MGMFARILGASASLAMVALSGQALAGKGDDTLNAGFEEEVATLDPYKEISRSGLILGRMLFDNLLLKDHKSGEFKPALAASYKVIDGKTLEFEIRKGVKFHDGSELSADDVVYTLNTVASKAYNARFQVAVNWIDVVEKTGPNTVRLRMKSVYPLALEMLAGNLPIFSKRQLEAGGSAAVSAKPIGTGPYRLVEMTAGTRYVLERFDDYYADSPKGRPAIKRLIVRVLPEANVQYAELLNGQLDWIWRLPPDAAKRLSGRPNITVKSWPIMRIGYISMNPHFEGGKSPLADVRVRQAINYAVDKQKIIKALVGGVSEPLYSACHPVQFGCSTDVTKYGFDPKKAKALLTEAGYPNGFALELLTAPSFPRAHIEAIAANLSAIGIRTTINEQQPAPARTTWTEGRAAAIVSAWGAYGVGDAALGTSPFFGGTGDDIVKDPKAIADLKIADSSADREERKKHYAAAQRYIADQAYWLPLWTYSVNTAQNSSLILDVDPDEFVPFYRASWK